ncbi:MAG: monofunctional biosynthetic peptidoglycan transglycosylase [Gemmatimonas sp.]|nr:monofunctional biosynthetic peptidoglycan transglycosylase [Gemmatimonas sp.]
MRILRALFLLAIAPIPLILLFAVVNPPVTMVMVGRAAERLGNGNRPIWPQHSPIARAAMNDNIRRAVLASEDDRFYLHNGIDFVEIDKALDRRKRGGKLRGASTLTQQVAKNIFLWNGRSFIRKGIEAYLTLLLELLLTKERILDLYLNLAEWGPNQFGIEAGAQYHFKKHASQLTREEAARMAAILPSPRKWSPRGSIASRRIAAILGRMQYAAPKTDVPK